MRRGSRFVGLAAALAAGLVALAPAAAAAPGGSPGSPLPRLLAAEADHQAEPGPREFIQPTVPLGKQNGSKIETYGSGGRVYLTVDHGHSISIYVAPGIVTSRRLEADFGSLGRVSLRFRVSPNRTWVRPNRECSGKHRFVNRLGVFTGTVAFRGENGYVSVRTHRAKGYVTAIAAKCVRELREAEAEAETEARLRPSGTAASSRSSVVPGFLSARRQDAGSVTSLTVERGGGGTSSFVESSETRGRLTIIRYAYADGGPSRLEFNDPLDMAKLSLPAPFYGSATYSAAADGSKTWQGSLSVNFPGAPRTPLTGDGFKVRLSAGF